MMTSEKFKEKGYVPNHPLYFESKVPIRSAASLLLRVFVHKENHHEEVEEMVKKLEQEQSKALTRSGELAKKYLVKLKEEVVDLVKYNRNDLKRDMLSVYEGVLAILHWRKRSSRI